MNSSATLINDIQIKYKEFLSSRGQNVSPSAEDYYHESDIATLWYDAQRGWTRNETNITRRERLFNPVIVMKGDDGFFYWPETKELAYILYRFVL